MSKKLQVLLHKLKKKDKLFSWTGTQQSAFDTLKKNYVKNLYSRDPIFLNPLYDLQMHLGMQ